MEDHVKKWRRFVDETFAYVKIGSVECVLSILNSFHKNMKQCFTVFRCFFIRDDENLNTTVYREDTLASTLKIVYTDQLGKKDIEVIN